MTLIIRKMLALTGISGLIALTGCLPQGYEQTGYAPTGTYAGFPHGGYDDARIKTNTAVVSFSGNQYTPQKTVYNYMMYRCAQVTLQNGYDYFVITSNTRNSSQMNLVTNDVYRPVDNPPRLYDSYYKTTTIKSYNYTNSKVPGYIRGNESAAPGNAVVIKMFQGRVPPGLPHAFDAQDVIARFGPATF